VSALAFLELADPASGVHAWLGRGLPGLDDGESVLIAFEGEQRLAAGRTKSAVLELDGETARAEASLDGLSLKAEASAASAGAIRSGTARLTLADGGAERPAVDTVAAFGRLALANGSPPGVLRSLSALPAGDGPGVAAGSARPEGVSGHDQERLAAWLLPASGEMTEVQEPLLSTQYDESGAQSRAGLELWVDADDRLPMRVAGVRVSDAAVELDGWRLQAAFFRWTVEGAEAAGSYLIWRRGVG
jgi:hypothetical protein